MFNKIFHKIYKWILSVAKSSPRDRGSAQNSRSEEDGSGDENENVSESNNNGDEENKNIAFKNATAITRNDSASRTTVLKTYKLFIKGEFPRSESGRSFPVMSVETGELIAHAAKASRKDLRAAVEAAAGAHPNWAKKTAFNRGQILYRVAEILETRAESFATELGRFNYNSGGDTNENGRTTIKSRQGQNTAKQEIFNAIDCWVWYAGWADKYSAITGSANPVSGPYFNFTTPEPMGVVGIIIGESQTPLLTLINRLAPALVSGNSVVLLAPESVPLPAITLSEALAVSDIPPGVVNILTGDTAELATHFLSHKNINAVDISSCPKIGAGEMGEEVLGAAADSIKRVINSSADEQSPYAITDFCEMKTVWHPVGK